jgi:hypothetical protein
MGTIALQQRNSVFCAVFDEIKQGQLAVAVSELFRKLLQFGCCGMLCEKLVAEARDSSGTQRKRNIHCWKLLRSNGSKDMIVDSRVYVIVNCKV